MNRSICSTRKSIGSIDFNRVFFQHQPRRPLAEIDAELAEVEKRIMELLREVAE